MKNIKILIASCLMLVCAANLSAQWRFGMEYNYTFLTQYNYDSYGFYESKNMNYNGGAAAFLTAEYILPRKWTPNWMAISIQGKFGGGLLSSNNYSDYSINIYDSHTYIDEIEPTGLMVPIDLELKFLLSNNCRFFINGGVPNMVCFSKKTFYSPGYEVGAGFEFGFFRIGYKNVNYNNSFLPDNKGNKYNNLHTLSMAYLFNGNRFLKKKSNLKIY